MKILHIIQPTSGGSERYLFMLLKNMQNQGYEHILVCSYGQNITSYKDYISDYKYMRMNREISLVDDTKAILKFRKIIKSINPDIIYCHSSKAGAVGRIANIGLGYPIVYNAHGWAFNMDCSVLKRNIYRWIEKILSVFTTYIIAISDYEKNSALKNGICGVSKIQTICNGIDLDACKKQTEKRPITRKELGIPDDAYVIGCVGRLSKQKAPDVFVKAASKIKKRIPNAYFLMVGDGEEKLQVSQLVENYGLSECFCITGWVDNPMAYIVLFDQAVHVARWEGFGLVLAEYMWAEKPIIATNVDAIPDLIKDGINGYLVEKDNISNIVEACLQIHDNEVITKNFKVEGKKRVLELFSVERVVCEHMDLFNRIVSEKS
ncbi:MAG: glycosyltransferase family 4 protein [Lachnospiraceae bacterium]|nr:glycosyltransferase family 4 protein [Lachnospiraceae bacterium]